MSERGISRREFVRLLAMSALAYPSCVPRRESPANVVLVMVDQLRLDAAERAMTGITGLARQGIAARQMRSVAPWTYPSVLSLMSGLYPQQHGADGHLHENILSHFDPQLPLLQGLLRSAGYRTAAFVANPFLMDWNAFHLDFDHFDASFIANPGNLRAPGPLFSLPDTMFGDSVTRAVVKHFDAAGPGAPELTYLHYIDVHGPWNGAPFAPRYGAAVRFLDRILSELYRYFLDRYAGRLLFVVTSDHGRALGRDEQLGDGPEFRKNKASLHEFNLRIPFYVLPSDLVREARVLQEPCSNVDVLPTLLEWLGMPLADPLPGISLLPAIRSGQAPGGERALYARHSAFGDLSDGIVYRGRKYIRHLDPDTREVRARRVFDLERDPEELRSLGEEFGEVASRLARESGTHGRRYASRFEPAREDVQERLRALGYLR